MYPEIMGDLTRGIAELIGTGSTARGTNLPNDADYDYILRIDKQELLNNADFVTRLKKYLNPTEIIPSKSNRFRGKAIHTISNYENIDFDIDVTFTGKTNKMDYSTDMALTERLNAIKEQHPDSYDKVRANIIMAKSLLKQAGVYKSSKSDPKQGGLGGVGIENWILQNNGSLEQAIDEFLEAAQNENGELFPFEEFKKKYHIWDFGANHDPYIPGYPYDDFVEFNMTEKGYEKMCNVLIKYKNELNKSNNRNK